MAETASLQRRLSRFMVERGLKQTRQRQTIFETFVASTDHVAIDEILDRVKDRMPGVGYATVYRAMKLFAEAGVAQERHFGDGQTRYEPARADEHHDHLICVSCGHIFEFEDLVIEERQREVADRNGLRIVSHHHDIFGACLEPEQCPHRQAQAAVVR